MTEPSTSMNNKPERDDDDQRERRSRQKRIGNQLRRLYEDVATEPVPDDFLQLLEEADRKKK
ncbi:MAG: hypothetical protein CMK06_05290 [Ponticaulis sp.]|nr:hypothetical protein [Ponticaulis sp.]